MLIYNILTILSIMYNVKKEAIKRAKIDIHKNPTVGNGSFFHSFLRQIKVETTGRMMKSFPRHLRTFSSSAGG